MRKEAERRKVCKEIHYPSHYKPSTQKKVLHIKKHPLPSTLNLFTYSSFYPFISFLDTKKDLQIKEI